VFALSHLCFAQEHPKYGPEALPLSTHPNREYFVKNKAPDFWALIPFYVQQENESSCSAAALVTVLNAARRDLPLTSADELVSHKTLTEKFSDEKYKASVSGDPKEALKAGVVRLGVSVKRLGEVLEEALGKLKISYPGHEVKVLVVDQSNKEKSRKEFHAYLVQNEKSANDFMLINFTQGVLTGDSEGMVGHIAAVGAYDSKHKWVLILDPDRHWYEPYWSPEDKVFDAIADSRSDATPGYVYFKLK
jgi:hypothetical protein